ncbi:hypothetical protein [Rhodopila sp.]|uniref:hypothetical protein n=1 Tax=Rhodopila sp. TaxID=2480087 RepID=UPI003D1166E3
MATAAIALNYFDRSALAIDNLTIRREFGIIFSVMGASAGGWVNNPVTRGGMELIANWRSASPFAGPALGTDLVHLIDRNQQPVITFQ